MRISVQSSPTRGKANKEIIKFFSELFDLHSSLIKIVKGELSSNKILQISDISREEILDKISKDQQARKMQ